MMTQLTAPADPIVRHDRRFQLISRLGIVVSFSHMFGTIALYAASGWIDWLVAGGNTLMVDLIVWSLAEYRQYCRRRARTWSPYVDRLFGLALVIAIALNAGSLWTHKPDDAVIPAWMSAVIAVAFALLVPGFIAVSSIVAGELDADRLAEQDEARQVDDDRTQLRDDLAAAQRRLAELQVTHDRLTASQAQIADLQTALAHAEAQRNAALTVQQALETAQARLLPDLRASSAEVLDLRQTIAQRDQQLRDVDLVVVDLRDYVTQQDQRLRDVDQVTAQLRDDVRDRDDLITQLRDDVRGAELQTAHVDQATAQLRDDVRGRDDLIAQLRTTADQTSAVGDVDLRAVARRLAGEKVSARAIARSFGRSDSTIRAWLVTSDQEEVDRVAA